MRLPALLAAALLFTACARREKDLVARVGPLEVSRAEYHRKLGEVAPEYQSYLLTPNGRKQFLEILVREKLILAAARDDHIAATEEFRSEVEKLKDEQRRRLKEFEEYLLTKLWIDGLRRQGVLKVNGDEIEAYYAASPREVRLRHILVADPKEGERLLKRLKKGADFGKLAAENSIDQDTAAKGGRLPPLLRGEVLPELEDVAFKMKTNETIGVVQSKFGYHLLRKDSDRRIPLDDAVRERIRKLLEKQKLDKVLDLMQDRYPVEVIDAQLK